jgi:hypothetical protein
VDFGGVWEGVGVVLLWSGGAAEWPGVHKIRWPHPPRGGFW